LEDMKRSLCSVLSRSQQMTWDNLIFARNIFLLHFALRKSESTVNNILSILIYSAQFHEVLPLTQLEQDQSLIIKKTHFYSCSPALYAIYYVRMEETFLRSEQVFWHILQDFE